MEINLYFLSYCEHCNNLIKSLKEEGVKFNAYDADDYLDESHALEQLLDTETYPIVEVRKNNNVIYFVGDDIKPTSINNFTFVYPYETTQHLIFEIKKFIK